MCCLCGVRRLATHSCLYGITLAQGWRWKRDWYQGFADLFETFGHLAGVRNKALRVLA